MRHHLLLLHFLAEHGLKGPQDLLLVVLAEHVGKLCHLFALLGTTHKVFPHDAKLYLRALLLHVAGNDLLN